MNESRRQPSTPPTAREFVAGDEATAESLADLDRRARDSRRRFAQRQPKRAADVVADIVQRRGYARQRTAAAWEQAWKDAAGDYWRKFTRAAKVQRGVLEVIVANSLVAQELGFEKERLLASVRAAAPQLCIRDIRFRIGPVE